MQQTGQTMSAKSGYVLASAVAEDVAANHRVRAPAFNDAPACRGHGSTFVTHMYQRRSSSMPRPSTPHVA